MLEVQIWDARKMTEAEMRIVADLLCTVWPKPGRSVETRVEKMTAEAISYDGPDETAPRSVVIFDGDRLVAHAAIFCRRIGADAGDLTVAGLARVCSAPQERGRGLGEQIVRAAFNPVDDGSFALSLFQTNDEVQPFYEKLGARRVQNRFINSLGEDPKASPWWDSVHMIYPAHANWPEGTIDLRGPGY